MDELLTGGGDVVIAAQTALSRAQICCCRKIIWTAFSAILQKCRADITASIDLSDVEPGKINDLDG